MSSADAWHESNAETTWPRDPNGSLIPLLEASVEVAKQRHPSASGDAPGVVLTAADRCDNDCSAAALYRLKLRNMVLDFCHHHKAKYFPEMEKWGWEVVGQNPTLLAELYSDDRTSRE